MDKLQKCCALVILCVLFMAFGCCNNVEEDDKYVKKSTFIERLTSLLFVSSPTSFGITSSNWDNLKALLSQVHAYFRPPNLDFRGSEEQNPVSASTEGVARAGGPGEKVKEAAARSLEKSKETVAESARSAAKIAGEAVQKTGEKVKKSFSMKRDQDQRQQSEL